MKNATPHPISMAGIFHRKDDLPPNAEPMIRPTIIMLNDSKTILKDNRLLIRSNFDNKNSTLVMLISNGNFPFFMMVVISCILLGKSIRISSIPSHLL